MPRRGWTDCRTLGSARPVERPLPTRPRTASGTLTLAWAGVLSPEHLAALRPFLETVKPWPAVFDPAYVKKLSGENVKSGKSKRDLAEQVSADIESFRKERRLSRLVMVWCGSTEVYRQAGDVHSTLARFERGLDASDPEILPSMIYAYAAIKAGIPYANGAPNLSADVPALLELARKTGRRSRARTSRPVRP